MKQKYAKTSVSSDRQHDTVQLARSPVRYARLLPHRLHNLPDKCSSFTLYQNPHARQRQKQNTRYNLATAFHCTCTLVSLRQSSKTIISYLLLDRLIYVWNFVIVWFNSILGRWVSNSAQLFWKIRVAELILKEIYGCGLMALISSTVLLFLLYL